MCAPTRRRLRYQKWLRVASHIAVMTDFTKNTVAGLGANSCQVASGMKDLQPVLILEKL
jgi:hypothetical protein